MTANPNFFVSSGGDVINLVYVAAAAMLPDGGLEVFLAGGGGPASITLREEEDIADFVALCRRYQPMDRVVTRALQSAQWQGPPRSRPISPIAAFPAGTAAEEKKE